MSRAGKRERNCTYDVLNIAAIIAVITLHHNGLVHNFDGGSAGWVQSLTAECLFYFAVPVFVMLSGANLLGYRDRYDTKTFFIKRIRRTVIPWAAWSVILLVWKLRIGEILMDPFSIHGALILISTYKVETAYWFFGALFPIYLAMPILSELRGNRKVLWYLAGLNFFFVALFPYIRKPLHISWNMDMPMTGELLIYPVLGYLFTSREIGKRERIAFYILGIAAMVFRFFYTWHFSLLNGETDTSIKGYRTFHSVLYACAVFLAFQRIPWNRILPERIKKILPAVSGCSFGIYLIHRLVMHYESQLIGIGNQNWTWRILCIPLTYIISLGIVALLKKIPLVKHIMG